MIPESVMMSTAVTNQGQRMEPAGEVVGAEGEKLTYFLPEFASPEIFIDQRPCSHRENLDNQVVSAMVRPRSFNNSISCSGVFAGLVNVVMEIKKPASPLAKLPIQDGGKQVLFK